jgi:PAS domain S-box-containing protein
VKEGILSGKHELRASDAGLILDSVADGVFAVDREWRITYFNKAAERITGFSRKEALGQHCYNIFRASCCQEGCVLRKSIETGKDISGLRVDVLDRQNREKPLSVSTAVLKDSSGRVTGGVEIFRDLSVVEDLRREIRKTYQFRDMASKNHVVQEIFALIPDIAASRASVLIQGPTGSGKELLARAIHAESPRADGPFVKVNCGALPDSLLETELFGHVAGAFTDAKTARKGRFEFADKGTIFFDEIGDVSAAMQVRLLRVLQEGTFEPVGSSQSVAVDVRIISAANRDLRELVAQGRFREDLLYRVNTVVLELPPLARRLEDIPLLVEAFIEKFNSLMGKSIRGVSPGAVELFMRYGWPGNIRELEHAMEHAFVLVKGDVIGPEHLPPEIQALATAEGGALAPIERSEKDTIIRALEENGYDREVTARQLGVSRTTLWRRMKRYGIAAR